MFNSQTEAFLAWYGNLWETGGGDAEVAVAEMEKSLGAKFPELLRAVYLNTSLRDSRMLHLAALEKVRIEGEVLVFATDQQDSGSWGMPLVRLLEGSPQLVADVSGTWEDDGCSLEEFLRFFALMNRPYEAPFIDQSSYDQDRLTGKWERLEVRWKSLQHSVWTNGEAVLEEDVGNLGAKNIEALRRAARSLDIDDEEVDAALLENESDDA